MTPRGSGPAAGGGRRASVVGAAAAADGDAGGEEGKKPKREKVSRKAATLGLDMDNREVKKAGMSGSDVTQRFTNNDLYEIFKQGAKFLGAAARGVGRKELNSIELQMPKNIRSIVLGLVETNLKLLRDGSLHDVGLTVRRAVSRTPW